MIKDKTPDPSPFPSNSLQHGAWGLPIEHPPAWGNPPRQSTAVTFKGTAHHDASCNDEMVCYICYKYLPVGKLEQTQLTFEVQHI